MRNLVFLFLLLLSSGCATYTQEEITFLRAAHDKLNQAKTQSDEVTNLALRQFKDELITRAFGEIEQASLDEISKASVDGLTQEEANKILETGEGLRKTALESITKSYDTAVNHQNHKDFNLLWTLMYSYWTSKLSVEAQKTELIDKVFKMVGD